MQALGLILAFLIGFFVVKRISSRFSWAESIGFAFPVGLFLITLAMLLADWLGIALTSLSVLVMAVMLLALTLMLAFPRRREIAASLCRLPDFGRLNMVWLVCMLLLVYAEYSNFLKAMYFPTYDRDSLAGFDTIGFVAAMEHTYSGMSIFSGDYMPKIHQAGSYISYMPMLQLSYAYVYLLGAVTSKAVPAFFFLSFLFGFYGIVRRATSSPTALAVVTFCMMMTPEMFSFSSLSNTNVLHACMASSGILYVCLWQRRHEMPLLVLGSLLLAINCWLRAEGIVFVAAAFVIVAVSLLLNGRQQLKPGTAWRGPVIVIAAVLPFLLFQIYVRACGLTSESVVMAYPFFDSEKALAVLGGAWFLLADAPYYGWTFILFVIAMLLNCVRIVRRGEGWAVIVAFFCPLMLYFLLLYQIDYIWDSLTNVINFSAKRFLFCFVPVAWYYIVANPMANAMFTKLDSLLAWKK